MTVKALFLVPLVLALTVAFGGIGEAVPIQVGDRVVFYDGPGTTGGGEFYIDILGKGATASPFDFITFCLERNEYISYGVPYLVAGLSYRAFGGGVGGQTPPGGDPLDPKTAYLYYKFTMGTLGQGLGDGSQYLYTSSVEDANLLQNLIWFLEDEQVWTPTGKAVAWLADAKDNAGDSLWGVQVMNLTDDRGNPKQDQLVYVPEPATLLLLGSGLIGVFVVGRRQRV